MDTLSLSKKSEELYRSLFQDSLDGIYISTLDGKYIDVNPALVKILGYSSKEELLSINIPEQFYVSEKDMLTPYRRAKSFESRLKKKDGSIIWVEIVSRVIYDGSNAVFYGGIVKDITARKESEKEIKYLSFHDKLTDLYNRAYFEEELKRLNTKRQLPLSMVIGDVNGLKLVNDAFGHMEGDKLLKKIARILKSCCREEDIIARWGGDEFSILLPKTTERDSEEIVNRIRTACLKTNDQKIQLSISLGTSTKINDDCDIGTIVKEAEDRMYRRKLLEIKSISSSIISSLERTLQEKSYETEEHAVRMKEMALILGHSLKLSENKLNELSLLSTLHDIGKIAIPDEILMKPGKLTEKEWDIVKRHPEVGYNISGSSPQLEPIADAVLSHHEWWDGSGYPQGLKGENIPLISRIISIADAYDVMTHDRPYKKAVSKEEALEEFKRCAGTQFDPHLVKKFVNLLKKNRLNLK
ncbi:MAG: HD domain-containing phosphohydrolase [Candidatus Hydromicrobium sp.]